MNKYKIYYFLRLSVSTLFGVGIGVLLLFLAPYARELFDILVIAMGLLTTVLNLPPFFAALRRVRKRGEVLNVLMTFSSVVLGLFLMLLQTEFLLLLLGIYSVVLPLLRILLVEDRYARLKREIPRFLVGAVMVTIYLLDAEATVLRLGALIAFAGAFLYLVFGLISAYFIFSKK